MIADFGLDRITRTIVELRILGAEIPVFHLQTDLFGQGITSTDHHLVGKHGIAFIKNLFDGEIKLGYPDAYADIGGKGGGA